MERIRYADGFRSRGSDPAAVQATLATLAAREPLTAERTFEAARAEDSPLHCEFTWNGEAAVRELGLLRARSLIRAIVHVQVENEPPRHVYVHVPSDTGQGGGTYDTLVAVLDDDERYRRALGGLQAKFASARAALRELHTAAARAGREDRIVAVTAAGQAFDRIAGLLDELGA